MFPAWPGRQAEKPDAREQQRFCKCGAGVEAHLQDQIWPAQGR